MFFKTKKCRENRPVKVNKVPCNLRTCDVGARSMECIGWRGRCRRGHIWSQLRLQHQLGWFLTTISLTIHTNNISSVRVTFRGSVRCSVRGIVRGSVRGGVSSPIVKSIQFTLSRYGYCRTPSRGGGRFERGASREVVPSGIDIHWLKARGDWWQHYSSAIDLLKRRGERWDEMR